MRKGFTVTELVISIIGIAVFSFIGFLFISIGKLIIDRVW